jgi:hypothetical protein
MFVKLVIVGRQSSAADKNMAPISSQSASAKKERMVLIASVKDE